MIKRKLKEWILRYGTAEVFSILGTLIASWLVAWLSGNKIAIALAGTWGGNLGYYGAIIITDSVAAKRKLATEGKTFTLKSLAYVTRALLIEFGIAEAVDSLVARPLLLYYFSIWLGNLTLGLIAGVLVADGIFYVLAIAFYEMTKKKKLRKY